MSKEIKHTEQIEFPKYSIMDGQKMARIKVAASSGHKKSRNGCVEYGIY